MDKKVSVVMSIYSEPISWIEKSIRSILNQSFKNIEFVIIIDNPDNLEAIGYVESLKKQDDRVVVIRNDSNIGLGNSLNKGIQKASGDYIARMDADDISMRNRIEEEVKFLEKNKLDLVATNIMDMDMSGELTGKGTNYPTTNDKIEKYLKYGSCLPHPTWLGKRSLFLENPYSSLRACQDYELVARLAQKGYRLGVVPQALLHYRLNKNSISSKKKVFQKTVSFYVRDCYKNKRKISFSDLESFLQSSEGKKKTASLEQYYSKVSKLKDLYKRKEYLNFLFRGMCLFFQSKEARDVLKEVFVTRFI